MMRPTAASSSKTHEKPVAQPHKAPAPSKPGVLQKGKKKVEDAASKVEDVASKAKAAVTNGHGDEEHKADEEAQKESEPTEQAPVEAPADEASHEPAKEVTPVQDVDSSTAEQQTPHVEGETVR
jgi:hypothetical protein